MKILKVLKHNNHLRNKNGILFEFVTTRGKVEKYIFCDGSLHKGDILGNFCANVHSACSNSEKEKVIREAVKKESIEIEIVKVEE